MQFNKFIETHELLPNTIVKRDDEFLFETYGPELEFVKTQPPERIWTLVNDGKDDAVIPGFHFVNRLGYFITKS